MSLGLVQLCVWVLEFPFVYPERVNLCMHEIFQLIYSATLHEAIYQSFKVKLQGCAMEVVKCIYTWGWTYWLLGHQHHKKPIFHFTIKLINAILNQRHPWICPHTIKHWNTFWVPTFFIWKLKLSFTIDFCNTWQFKRSYFTMHL